MTSYHFAILRYVHDISAGEFVNVGVVAWSLSDGTLHTRLNERYSRASTFFAGFDGSLYRRFIRSMQRWLDESYEKLGQGDLLESPRDVLGSVLDRLLLDDDSAFQWSDPMGGVTDDLPERVDELFEELVLRHELSAVRERRDDQEVAKAVDQVIRERDLLTRIGRRVEIRSEDYEYTFHAGWSNGKRQVLEPISFDYVRGGDVVEKANMWGGRLFNLSRNNDFAFTGVVAPPQDPDLAKAFASALSILQHAPSVRRVVQENELESLVPEILRDLETSSGE